MSCVALHSMPNDNVYMPTAPGLEPVRENDHREDVQAAASWRPYSCTESGGGSDAEVPVPAPRPRIKRRATFHTAMVSSTVDLPPLDRLVKKSRKRSVGTHRGPAVTSPGPSHLAHLSTTQGRRR